MLTKQLKRQLADPLPYGTLKSVFVFADLWLAITNYCDHNHIPQHPTINHLLNEALENRLAASKPKPKKKAKT